MKPAHVIVVEEAQQFDFAQRALRVCLIVERVPDLLHSDLAARGRVSAGAYHAVGPFADRLRAAREQVGVKHGQASARQAEQRWAEVSTLARTLISPYFSATSNFVPRTMNSRHGSRPLDAACAISSDATVRPGTPPFGNSKVYLKVL